MIELINELNCDKDVEKMILAEQKVGEIYLERVNVQK
jgi:hypothetical protein